MRSRKYTKRIEIYGTTPSADGYGGNIQSEALLTTSWAEVKTVANNSRYASRLTDLGISDPQTAIIVKFRHRNDIDLNGINQYLKYNSIKYSIQNAIISQDLEDVDIEIIATRQASTDITSTPV